MMYLIEILIKSRLCKTVIKLCPTNVTTDDLKNTLGHRWSNAYVVITGGSWRGPRVFLDVIKVIIMYNNLLGPV